MSFRDSVTTSGVQKIFKMKTGQAQTVHFEWIHFWASIHAQQSLLANHSECI